MTSAWKPFPAPPPRISALRKSLPCFSPEFPREAQAVADAIVPPGVTAIRLDVFWITFSSANSLSSFSVVCSVFTRNSAGGTSWVFFPPSIHLSVNKHFLRDPMIRWRNKTHHARDGADTGSRPASSGGFRAPILKNKQEWDGDWKLEILASAHHYQKTLAWRRLNALKQTNPPNEKRKNSSQQHR